jgi:hypothetical protein
MGNLVKIASQTAGAGGVANFQFSGIPATYQDIFIVMSARSNRANAIDAMKVYFNTDTTAGNYRIFRLGNNTTTVFTETVNTWDDSLGFITGNNATANDFGSTYLYLANYSNTTISKSMNMRSGGSDNSSTSARSSLGSLRWSSTAAINQITILPQLGTLFVQNSTATLYGLSPQAAGGVGSKATGGTVTTSGGYTYHTFTATGNLVPTTNITGAEVLIVAGGGGAGGAAWASGGGGAGGLVYASSVSLTSGIKYPAIVGAGGLGGNGTQSGKNGYNSSFGNQTVAVGGGGGGGYTDGGATTAGAQVGGSGGGGSSGQGYGGTSTGAAGTAGQGNAGGNGYNNPHMTGGGGGGAGATGGNATTTVAGSGGNGSSSYSAWGAATSTGQNISGTRWYAGGGGGSSGGPGFSSVTGGAGGNGGGGFGGSSYEMYGSPGTPNTGGGGGAAPYSNMIGSGGSGIVIVRYTT